MAVTLTPEQAAVITKEIEFSVHFPMASLVKAFPSLTFVKRGCNGGVTYYYNVTGPTVWVEKVERKYAYPS